MLAGDTRYGDQGSRERVGGTMEARGGLTDKWRFEPRFQGMNGGVGSRAPPGRQKARLQPVCSGPTGA